MPPYWKLNSGGVDDGVNRMAEIWMDMVSSSFLMRSDMSAVMKLQINGVKEGSSKSHETDTVEARLYPN